MIRTQGSNLQPDDSDSPAKVTGYSSRIHESHGTGAAASARQDIDEAHKHLEVHLAVNDVRGPFLSLLDPNFMSVEKLDKHLAPKQPNAPVESKPPLTLKPDKNFHIKP